MQHLCSLAFLSGLSIVRLHLHNWIEIVFPTAAWEAQYIIWVFLKENLTPRFICSPNEWNFVLLPPTLKIKQAVSDIFLKSKDFLRGKIAKDLCNRPLLQKITISAENHWRYYSLQHSMSSSQDNVWSRDHRDAHGENEWADVLDMGLGVPPYIYWWNPYMDYIIGTHNVKELYIVIQESSCVN